MKCIGRLVTSTYQGVDGRRCEAEHTETADVGNDVDITYRAVIHPLGARAGDQQTGKDLGQRLQVVFGDVFRGSDLHADDDVGAHLTKHVGREIVHQAAVNQHHVTDADRRKHARDGHAGTHGSRDAAATQHDLFASNQVGGYTGERDRQVIEIHLLLITYTQVIEQVD